MTDKKLTINNTPPDFNVSRGDIFLQKYSNSSELYILSCIDITGNMCLVSLHDGNRWIEPVKVVDVYNVTQDEFEKIANKTAKYFIKVNNVEFIVN